VVDRGTGGGGRRAWPRRCSADPGARGPVATGPDRVARGFHWAAAEPGSGHPLLLREQFDGRQIFAGSTRYGIPAAEAVACYTGAAAPLRDAAKATGRVDDVSLRTGLFHVLSVHFDDLGGEATTYVYRCGPDGAQPLLSWGRRRGSGCARSD